MSGSFDYDILLDDDDPEDETVYCVECGCHLECDEHDWDCSYGDDSDEDFA